MTDLNSIATIKENIALLKVKQRIEGRMLKYEFDALYKNMQPINILKSVVADLKEVPNLKQDLIKTGISFAIGFLIKKLSVGGNRSPFLRLLGIALQIGVTKWLINKSIPEN